MHKNKKWKNLCSKIHYDGLGAYNGAQEQFFGHESVESSEHSWVQGTLYRHAKEIMLHRHVVC